MINTKNAKWNLSKEEKYAIQWFDKNGYDGKIEKQYISKTIFTVSKDGFSTKFELTQGLPKINMSDFMNRFENNFIMERKLAEIGD